MTKERAYWLLMASGLLLCLLQVWLPAYYVTGDGPCHVYNARVLRDIWSGDHASFYAPFYTLSHRPDPNWMSTIVMALLMYVVGAVTAEKLLLTIYVLVYVSGAHALSRKISPVRSLWPIAIFLLVFPLTLSKGFYNFSFSVSFVCWVVWAWLCFMDRRRLSIGLLLLLLVGLTFFTHLLSFGIAALTCASLLLSYGAAIPKDKGRGRFLAANGLALVLLFAPFTLLTGGFTARQGGVRLSLHHHFYRVIELVQCKFLVNVTHQEDIPALIAGRVFLLVFIVAVVKLFPYRRVGKYDGFIIAMLCSAFIWLFFPESFLNHLILINMRMQLFMLLFVILCVGYMLPAGKLKDSAAVLLFACFTIMSVFRIGTQVAASSATEEYLSVIDSIKPYSVVLPLGFSRNGKNADGTIISDRNFLFVHTGQYLGTRKPLIVLDNYEADMGYFPLSWKPSVNPYNLLSVGGSGDTTGIEGEPPAAAIAAYERASGIKVGYIVAWCFDSSFISRPGFHPLYVQLTERYHPIYTSPSGRVRLFQRN